MVPHINVRSPRVQSGKSGIGEKKDFCNTIPSRADVARPRPKFILSLVSQAIPIPLSSQCLGQLQSLFAREHSSRSACSGDHPNRNIWMACSRESHLEDPAHGRARKAPATRADAGGDSSNGYWYIRIDGKGYLGHRLAWLYMHGHFPDGALDHKRETHQAAGSRTCEKRRTAKTPQIQTCVQPLLGQNCAA